MTFPLAVSKNVIVPSSSLRTASVLPSGEKLIDLASPSGRHRAGPSRATAPAGSASPFASAIIAGAVFGFSAGGAGGSAEGAGLLNASPAATAAHATNPTAAPNIK